MNGHKPMTPEQAEIFEMSEHIEVVYSYYYRCKICGYTPDNQGCIPAMITHMDEKHGIKASEGKYFWMASYFDSDIKKLLDEQ